MKKGFQAILYIVIILILLVCLVLFLFRDQALSFLNESTGVASLEIAAKVATSSKDTLDTSLLSTPKFTTLKNNVSSFDFDSICKAPIGKTAAAVVAIQSVEGATSTEVIVAPRNCTPGNNIPFPVPVKKID